MGAVLAFFKMTLNVILDINIQRCWQRKWRIERKFYGPSLEVKFLSFMPPIAAGKCGKDTLTLCLKGREIRVYTVASLCHCGFEHHLAALLPPNLTLPAPSNPTELPKGEKKNKRQN